MVSWMPVPVVAWLDYFMRDRRKDRAALLTVMMLVVTALVVVGGVWLIRDSIHLYMQRVLEGIEQMQFWAPISFIGLEVLVVVLLIPGVIFTLGAGFLFGPVAGTAYVLIGNTLGAACAFALGRTLFRRRVEQYVEGHARLKKYDRQWQGAGWRTIMLTRLIPFFPFKLSNYAFGVMHFRLRDIVIGTFVGSIPITFVNVYTGSFAADIADMSKGQKGILWEVVVYGAGLAALIGLAALLTKRAQAQLGEQRGDLSVKGDGLS